MNWTELSFNKLFLEPQRNGLYKSKEHHGSGAKVINMGEIFAYDFIGPQEMKRVEVTDNELVKFGVTNGDLLFARRSLIESGAGKCVVVEGASEPIVFESSLIRVRLDPQRCNSRFFLYYFRDAPGRSAVKEIITGSAQKGIRGTELAKITVHCPPLPIQRKIASILSAYDDLIENNTRRIAILEEMAQAIYREWFVNFKFPGHENVKLVDSELGQIPEGWKIKQLQELADLRLGKMLDKKKNQGDLMPYLANVNVRWGEIDLQNLREMRFKPDELEKYGLVLGDIVMCEGGEPGRCSIWMDQVPRMMIQKAIHRIRSQTVDFRFLYFSLLYKGMSGQLESLFTGSTIKHLPREKLGLVQIEIPPKNCIDQFSKIVEPIINQSEILKKRNTILRDTRDLLLPKLISGKLNVEELSIDVGAIAHEYVKVGA